MSMLSEVILNGPVLDTAGNLLVWDKDASVRDPSRRDLELDVLEMEFCWLPNLP